MCVCVCVRVCTCVRARFGISVSRMQAGTTNSLLFVGAVQKSSEDRQQLEARRHAHLLLLRSGRFGHPQANARWRHAHRRGKEGRWSASHSRWHVYLPPPVSPNITTCIGCKAAGGGDGIPLHQGGDNVDGERVIVGLHKVTYRLVRVLQEH